MDPLRPEAARVGAQGISHSFDTLGPRGNQAEAQSPSVNLQEEKRKEKESIMI